MPRNPCKYLFDMLDSCRFLNGFIQGKTLDDLRMDRGFRSAVERELQIIGEACFILERVNPEICGRISEYKRIIRFRHVLVHGYDVVSPDITWEILISKIPLLTGELELLIRAEDKS